MSRSPRRRVPFWRGRAVASAVAALVATSAVPLVLVGSAPASAVTGAAARPAPAEPSIHPSPTPTHAAVVPSASPRELGPHVPPVFSFPTLPGGEVGLAYSQLLTVAGGALPLAWTIAAGALPDGLTLNGATGLLSGTPTAVGDFAFTVLVTDAAGLTDTADVVLSVVGPLGIDVPTIGTGEVGIPYSVPLAVGGGLGPFAWSVGNGSLPPGVTLDPGTGLIAGTPTGAGTFSPAVTVVDALGARVTRTVTLVVRPRPTLSIPSVPSGQIGVAYSYPLSVAGGVAPFAWAVTGGALPPGLALDPATGLLSGTPSTAGTYPFSVTVTDAKAVAATVPVTLVVTSGPLLVTQTTDTTAAAPGTRVHYTVTVTDTGSVPLTGIVVNDPLANIVDDATYAGDATATSGTVSLVSGTLVWAGALTPRQVATVTFSVVVNAAATGDGVLTSVLSSPTPGSSCPPGGSDPHCASRVTVSRLTVVTQADTPAATPGSTVHYTTTITNSGQTPYSALTVAESLTGVLDDAAYGGDAATTAGSVGYVAPTLTWTGPLAPGAVATVTFSVRVANPDTGDRTLTAVATSAAAGSICPAGSTDPRCTSTVPVLTPGLSLKIVADTATTTPGSTVHYTVTMVNTGQVAQQNVTVTDSLSKVLADVAYNGDAVASSGSVSYAAPNLTWTGSLGIGATATITYSVTVDNPDLGDKRTVSTLVSDAPGSTCPTGGTDPNCSAVVTVQVPALAVSVASDVTTAAQGGVVRYTVTITNTGQTVQTNAQVSEDFTALRDDATYNGDGAASTGTVHYAAPILTWTGTLAVGATATMSFTSTVKSPDTGDGLLTVTVTSGSAGSTCPVGGTDSRCTVTVRLARLAISQSYNTTTTTPGAVIRLTSTFTNTGQVPYAAISISSASSDVLDDAISNGDQIASSGSLTLTATSITWTGDIPVGATVTVTGTVTIKNPDTGNKLLTGTLVSTAQGNNCPSGGTDPNCTATATVLPPGLSFSNTANVTSVAPGGQVLYTVRITNTGAQTATGVSATVTLRLLDDATYDGNAATTGGTVTYTSPTIGWSGSIAAGATVTITYSVTVKKPDPGDKTMVTTVASDSPGSACPTGSGAAGCSNTVTVLSPGLTVVLTANRATQVAGSPITWTLAITNSGQTAYTNASVTDPLTAVLDDANYNNDAAATAGTVTYASQTISWSGALAVGASATVTYSTTPPLVALTGDGVMTSTVTSTTVGSNCAAGSQDTRCTATVRLVASTALLFTTTSDAATIAPGGIVHYTITLANNGVTPVATTVTDSLSTVVDDATYGANATATAGTATYSAPTLTWTGTIPALGSVTITFSVTVLNPDTGDKTLSPVIASAALLNNCTSGSTDPRCTTTTTVSGLTIVTGGSGSTTTPGATFTITATFTNSGKSVLNGISVTVDWTDVLDDAVLNGDLTATSGTLSGTASSTVWTGTIPVAGVVTLTTTLTVDSPDPGNKLLAPKLTSAAAGNNCPTGGTDTRCTLAATVLVPALTITNTPNVTSTTPGSVVGYTVLIKNTGQTAYTGISATSALAGVLDDATYNGNVATTAGTASVASGTLTWSGNLAVGAQATVTFGVTVLANDTGDKLLSNSIVSSAAGSTCPVASGNTSCTANVAVLTPALTFGISTSPTSTVPGGTVTYTITVTNNGQTAQTSSNLTTSLAALLDDAVYNRNATATVGTVSFTSPNLSWSGSLAVGVTSTIRFSVTVRNPDSTGNKSMVFTLRSTTTGSICASTSTDPRCTSTVPIAVLSIENTSDISQALPGEIVNYSVIVTNDGQVPLPGVTVADSLTAVLDDATYDGDALATSGSVAIATNELDWTGDLQVGDSVVISFSVTVRDPDPGDLVLTAVASSTTAGTNCPVGSPGLGCTAVVNVLLPHLAITTTADRSTVTPGGTVQYTVTIANTGQATYSGAEVDDSLAALLDDAVYNGDAAATLGSVTQSGSSLVWVGDLNPGDTAVVTFTANVRDPDPGDKLITNTVTSDEAGSSCPSGGTGAGCSAGVAVLVPGLSMSVATSGGTGPDGGVVAGDVVTYTVTVVNTGQTSYSGLAVGTDLTGALDDAVYRNDATALVGGVPAGTVAFVGGTLGWLGNLDPGQTMTLTFSVATDLPDPGDRVLSTALTSNVPGSPCPTGGTDPACASTLAIGQPGLTMSVGADKTAVVTGDTVHYTVVLTNTGDTPVSGAAVTDALGGVLDDATYAGDATATAGDVAFSSPNLVWTGDLAPGASAVVTYSVVTQSPDLGDGVLVDTIASAARGSTCPVGGGGAAACTSTVTIIPQSISLTNLTPSFTLSGAPGDTVDGPAAVTMTVTTNDVSGYAVSVLPAVPSLTGLLGGNGDSIPVGRLLVRESGGGPYTALSASTPVQVHVQHAASATGGDAISNDYQVAIPFVRPDTYSATLTYVAATL